MDSQQHHRVERKSSHISLQQKRDEAIDALKWTEEKIIFVHKQNIIIGKP